MRACSCCQTVLNVELSPAAKMPRVAVAHLQSWQLFKCVCTLPPEKQTSMRTQQTHTHTETETETGTETDTDTKTDTDTLKHRKHKASSPELDFGSRRAKRLTCLQTVVPGSKPTQKFITGHPPRAKLIKLAQQFTFKGKAKGTPVQ